MDSFKDLLSQKNQVFQKKNKDGKNKKIGMFFQDKQQKQEGVEDYRATQYYFSQYMLFDTSCTLVAIMGVVLSAITYELEYEHKLEHVSRALLWVIFISCILNALFTIVRYQSFLNFKKTKGNISQKGNLLNTGLLLPCITEFILVLIHPSPFLLEKSFEFKNSWAGPSDDQETFYYYNEILSFLGISKLVLVLRTLLMMTRWYSNRAYRVGSFYGVEPNLLFICKVSMKYTPYSFITALYVATVAFFGFGIHIAESALQRGALTGFNNYLNSFWCIIVTMTTVGYGDFYPYSLLGRFIIIIVSIIGTYITSLMVLSLTNTLATSHFENRAICVLDRLEYRQVRRKNAALALTQLAVIARDFKNQTLNKVQYEQKKQKLIRTLKQLSYQTEEYRATKDENFIEELQRQFELLRKEMYLEKVKQQEILLKKIKIMKQLDMDEEIIEKFGQQLDKNLFSDTESSSEESEADNFSQSQNSVNTPNLKFLMKQNSVKRQESGFFKQASMKKQQLLSQQNHFEILISNAE